MAEASSQPTYKSTFKKSWQTTSKNFNFKSSFFTLEEPYIKKTSTKKRRQKPADPKISEKFRFSIENFLGNFEENVEKNFTTLDDSENLEENNPTNFTQIHQNQLLSKTTLTKVNEIFYFDKSYLIKCGSDVSDVIYYLPEKSTFINSDLETLIKQGKGLSTCHQTNSQPPPLDLKSFDLIYLDPPWHNKSMRRKRSYETFGSSTSSYGKTNKNMTQEALLELNFGTGFGKFLAIWVTNADSVQDFVRGEFAKRHGLVMKFEVIGVRFFLNFFFDSYKN